MKTWSKMSKSKSKMLSYYLTNTSSVFYVETVISSSFQRGKHVVCLWGYIEFSRFLASNKATLYTESFISEDPKAINLFYATLSFFTSWKHQKTYGFLMFSWGIERDQWHEVS